MRPPRGIPWNGSRHDAYRTSLGEGCAERANTASIAAQRASWRSLPSRPTWARKRIRNKAARARRRQRAGVRDRVLLSRARIFRPARVSASTSATHFRRRSRLPRRPMALVGDRRLDERMRHRQDGTGGWANRCIAQSCVDMPRTGARRHQVESLRTMPCHSDQPAGKAACRNMPGVASSASGRRPSAGVDPRQRALGSQIARAHGVRLPGSAAIAASTIAW